MAVINFGGKSLDSRTRTVTVTGTDVIELFRAKVIDKHEARYLLGLPSYTTSED